MADVRMQLNQIWTMFRSVGVADDLVIIEYIARLLIEQVGLKPPRSELLPQLPASNVRVYLNEMIRILRDLSNDPNIGGSAELFDRYVLFRLSETLPGERYPTPRHIVRFMHMVAGVGPEHHLADFACGSGGTLALRLKPIDDAIRTFGCEIAQSWARLAWANCALHGIPNPTINIGDALGDALPDLAPMRFDRVLMNPPFGTRATQSKTSRTVGRSETALTNLALDSLADRGRACVLTPSTTLFGGGAEEKLRRTLVNNYSLDAIISLPKDAFQPYSPLQTHLLLATRTAPDNTSVTWFLRAERDGYNPGRGRDLTQPPDEDQSDLPWIAATLARHGDQWDHTYLADQPLLGWKQIATPQSGQGLVVGAIGSTKITRVERYDAGDISVLLINLKHGEQSTLLAFDLTARQAETVSEAREGYLRNKLNIPKQEELPNGVLLHREENGGIALAIASDGRLLGTLVPQTTLRQNGYDLRPERYAQAEEQRGTLAPPGKLLADIRTNQRHLTRRIDGLLGRLEMPPVAEGQVLAPIWLHEEDGLAPLIGLLSHEQRAVWEKIRAKTMPVRSGDDIYHTPMHFTVKEITDAVAVAGIHTAVDSTINLLEHLGLIMAVSVLEQPGQQRIAAYRLVSERDRWNVETPQAEAAP